MLLGSKHDIEAEFQKFWAKYPRKVGKRAAQLKFRKACERADVSDIMKGLEEAIIRFKDTEIKFIPYPATWLHQDRWLDEVEEEVKIEDPHNDLDSTCKIINEQFEKSQRSKGNWSNIDEVCDGKCVIDNWLKTTKMSGWDRYLKIEKIMGAMKTGTIVTSFAHWEARL